jgi:hypothetical protein
MTVSKRLHLYGLQVKKLVLWKWPMVEGKVFERVIFGDWTLPRLRVVQDARAQESDEAPVKLAARQTQLGDPLGSGILRP